MRTESLAVALTARRETDFGRQRLEAKVASIAPPAGGRDRTPDYLNRGNA